MRNLPKIRNFASEAAPLDSAPRRVPGFHLDRSLAMPHEIIPILPASESILDEASRSAWVHYPKRLLQDPGAESGQPLEQSPRQAALPCAGVHGSSAARCDERNQNGRFGFDDGPSLFQEVFFFCTVKERGRCSGSRLHLRGNRRGPRFRHCICKSLFREKCDERSGYSHEPRCALF